MASVFNYMTPGQSRKAIYKATARDIVWRDRNHKGSKDTAGAIARAMEKAYQEGLMEARGEQVQRISPNSAPLDWNVIPPRARRALSLMCSWSGILEGGVASLRLKPGRDEKGVWGWVSDQLPGGTRFFGTVKDVIALARLGLIDTDDHVDEARLSAAAIEMWERVHAQREKRRRQYKEMLEMSGLR